MSEIKIQVLRRLFKRVNLGGLIGECVLEEGKDGMSSIAAIDLTNSIVLTVFGKTNFEGFDKLGISDLDTMVKYLDSISVDDETTLKVVENRLIFKNKNGTFKFLLSQPDLIPTTLDEKDALKKLIDDSSNQVEINEDFKNNFLRNIALTKTNNVSITVGDEVRLSGGLESEHKFLLKIGTPKKLIKSDAEQFVVPIYGTHLAAVLNVLNFTVRENYPRMYLKEDKPIIVRQGRDAFALTIITKENK